MCENYPAYKDIYLKLKGEYPLIARSLDYIRSNFDDRYYGFANATFARVFKDDANRIDRAIKSFIKYSNEFLVLQSKLNKTGRYLYSTHKEVEEVVYMSPSAMGYYLDGLLLSQFFWPNHYKILAYFEDYLADKNFDLILDAPCGSGLQSYVIANRLQNASIFSCDLSPWSVDYSRNLNQSIDKECKIDFAQKNIFELNGSYDFICCGELLEHLESPDDLLIKLKHLMRTDARVFLTTAVYAAAIDHIYLFRSVNDVRELLNRHFSIESELILPVSLQSYRADMINIPINYACILKAN